MSLLACYLFSWNQFCCCREFSILNFQAVIQIGSSHFYGSPLHYVHCIALFIGVPNAIGGSIETWGAGPLSLFNKVILAGCFV